MEPDRNVRADTPSLASAVRSQRRRLGLRQQELADLAGVSERFLYALENGKSSVQFDKVLAVVAALGLHLELRRGGADVVVVAPGAGGDLG